MKAGLRGVTLPALSLPALAFDLDPAIYAVAGVMALFGLLLFILALRNVGLNVDWGKARKRFWLGPIRERKRPPFDE
jgi:hypothetical protein